MSEINSGELSPSEKMNKKEIVVSNITGTVKWFNVELGYGFINRDDTNEDIFVHHTAIAKYNTRHQLSSLADKEAVEFDVVRGHKGLEASNVTGPNGEQVKGSRFASNLYAGRFRFRRGRNYGRDGGGGSGSRFSSRPRYHDRSSKDTHENSGDEVKRDKVGGTVINEQGRVKVFSRARKPFTGGPMVLGHQNGRGNYGGMRRSNSLPSDLNRYQNGNVQQGRRRRRRGPPRGADQRPNFRPQYLRRRPRTSRTSEKEYTLDKDGKKVLEYEHTEQRGDTSKSEKEKSTDELKGHNKGKSNSRRQRQVSEGKSEKTEPPTNEKSEKSQQSQGRKQIRRNGNRTKKNSEPAVGKLVEVSKATESADEDRHVTDDGGNGTKEKGQRRRNGRWRGKRSGRGGARSSSVEVSTRTPSTRGGEESVKSDKELPGGNGDGANTGAVVVSGVGLVVAVPNAEPVADKA